MKRAIVLGAGMVGSVMAADLAADAEFDVTIADLREESLTRAAARLPGRIKTLKADLSNPDTIRSAVGPFDIVLGALSSRIGFGALRAVIEAGKPYCDISFMAEDFLELDALARKAGVTCVTDCGVAPGMSNILAAYGARQLDRCERIEIYVGGLPRERRWPFEYKAGFSPADVIEEYTRPSRMVEFGQVVTREALSEPALIDFDGVGTLEAFNTDGLRSLIETVGRRYNVPFMKEQTLRYPGHIELMRVMRETGLFSKDEIKVGSVSVRPLDVISTLMFPKWTYAPGEQDLTVMRITAQGLLKNAPATLRWDLLDFYDTASQSTSMSRTTAFPCTIVARMIARGEFNNPGVNAPEALADHPVLVEKLLRELAARNVRYSHRTF
jgi:lysine 6-dehydrogenase